MSHQPETYFPAGVHCFLLPKIETLVCAREGEHFEHGRVWLKKKKNKKTFLTILFLTHSYCIFKRKTLVSAS